MEWSTITAELRTDSHMTSVLVTSHFASFGRLKRDSIQRIFCMQM